MDAESVELRLREVAARTFKRIPTTIRRETRLREDLGADSLDLVVLVHELESAFCVEIPDQTASALRTVGDVIDFVTRTSAP
jgi:acyl carrier protein